MVRVQTISRRPQFNNYSRDTVPLKRAPIEVKQILSSSQTRMHCARMSETHGNIIFYLRINLCVRVWDPQKRCKKKARKLHLLASKVIPTRIYANSDTHTTHTVRVWDEDDICFTLMGPSLNDRSKLKGQCIDVKNGCSPSVGPSLSPHSLS